MKKLIAFSLALFLVPMVADAFPIFQALQGKLGVRGVEKGNCRDFSGSWKGSCSVDGTMQDNLHTKIAQYGCNLLDVDGSVIGLGGLGSASVLFPYADAKTLGISLAASADWTANKTAVKSHYSGVVQVTGHAGSVTIDGESLMRMNGAQLVFDATVYGVQISCIYDKE